MLTHRLRLRLINEVIRITQGSGVDELIEIFKALKEIDPSITLRKFSREYSGMSEIYLFSRRYYGKTVSVTAKLTLYKKLVKISCMWAEVYAEYGRAHYLMRHKQYSDIAEMAESALFA